MAFIFRCKHGKIVVEQNCVDCTGAKLYPRNGMTLGNFHPKRDLGAKMK